MSTGNVFRLFYPINISDIQSFTPDAVTSGINSLILGVFVIIFLWCVIYWYCSERRRFKQIIKQLSYDKMPEPSASMPMAFRRYAEACIRFNGRTYAPPAKEFFNGETLGSGILHSRWLPFMPTLITGLGVLGTFLGLTIGLQGFDLGGSSAQVNEQIKNMTASASTAFATSVCGVAFSLLSNFILKGTSAFLNRQIRAIQQRAEGKFSSESPAEAFLKDVSENLRGSKDALDLLAEKIGNSIQEGTQSITSALASQTAHAEMRQEAMLAGLTEQSVSMAEAMAVRISEAIKGSIGDAILPAVQQLMTDSAANMRQASDELKAMLQNFSQHTGNTGEALSASVLHAVENLRSTVESSVSNSSRLFEKLSIQQEEFSQGLNSRNNGLLNELKTVMENQQKTVGQMLESSSNIFNALLEKQQQVMREVDRVFQENTENSGAMLSNTEKLLSAFSDNAEEMRRFSKAMDALCAHIQSASLSMEKMGTGIDATMRQVSSSVGSSVTAAEHLVEEGRRVGEGFTSAAGSLDGTRSALAKAAASFADTAQSTAEQYDNLSESYNRLQHTIDKYVQEMNEQVGAIMENYNSQVEAMMKRYAEQVIDQTNDRLISWDSGTKDFCERLSQVIAVMGDIVDERSNRRG